METVNRRAIYRLYPTPAQDAALHAQREAHRLLYNAALEQRKAAWTRQRVSLGYPQQCHDLTALRQTEATPLPAQDVPAPIANPRFLGQSAARLKAAYQARDTKQQFSHGWRLANKRVAQLHSKVARQRLDFHHKQAATMVDGAAAICTEQLQPANMVRRPRPKKDETTGQHLPNGAAAKAGLNKAILDSAPAQFLGILRYKAAEAGVVYVEAPTRALKPSQRCYACGAVVKKSLHERWHTCPCGASCGRDVNSALVLLAWGIEHILSVFFATLGLRHWSQELAPGLGPQHRPREP